MYYHVDNGSVSSGCTECRTHQVTIYIIYCRYKRFSFFGRQPTIYILSPLSLLAQHLQTGHCLKRVGLAWYGPSKEYFFFLFFAFSWSVSNEDGEGKLEKRGAHLHVQPYKRRRKLPFCSCWRGMLPETSSFILNDRKYRWLCIKEVFFFLLYFDDVSSQIYNKEWHVRDFDQWHSRRGFIVVFLETPLFFPPPVSCPIPYWTI